MLGPLDQSGKPKIIHYIFARAIVGSSAMVCVYQAYARFPIGDTGAITNSNVVWTSLIGMNFKDQKFLQKNQSWMRIPKSLCFKGSSDSSHFIFETNAGKSRIRHTTTLKWNGEFRPN